MLLKRLTIVFIFVLFFNLLSFNALATFNFLGTVRYNNGTVVPGALVNITTAPFFFPGAPANLLVQQNFSGITNATGNFVVNVTNSSQEGFLGNYRLRVYLNKSDGNATHISALYPELPQFALESELSGGNIYIGPAATIILDGYNGSAYNDLIHNASYANYRGNVSFSGMIIDNSLGMPVDFFAEFSAGANGGGNVTSHRFVVPVGRNYSIVMYKPFNLSAVGAGGVPATPPAAVTIQILNATNAYNLDRPAENFTNATYGLVINYTRNLTFVKVNISGFVNVTGNATVVNFTRILAYPMISNYVRIDMPVFIAPADQDMIAATGRYSISLVGGATAITYLLVGVGEARNASALTTYFGGFVNVSVGNNDINGFNFTLEKLAGSYSNANNNLNMSQIILNVSGASMGGDSNVQGAFVVVEANYTTNAGQTFIKYVVSPNTSGMAALPLIERYDGNITAKVFSAMFAPKKIKLNITNSTYVPVKLKTFNMEKLGRGNNNGSSGLNFTGMMNLKVFVNNATCNVFMPPSSCSLMGAGEGARAEQFSPMKFMLGGAKINMRIDQDATGISVMFVGVDILGSGPPDASFNDQAEDSGSSNDLRTQNWKFGSGAPEIYDWVVYGIHYEDSAINDSFKINTTMPTLYDNDWNAIWNGSSNTLGQNVPGDFAGFNNSWFNQSNPMHCDSNISKVITINTTYQGCYVNTTNNTIWISVPHFSGQLVQTTSSGTKVSSGSSSTPSSGSSSIVDSGTAKTTTTPEAAVETNSIANEIKQSAERISTILEDLKIKAAVQDIVGSLPLNEVAKNSEAVSKSVSVSRSIESKTSTVLTTNIKYAGKDLVKDFMVYDIIPKTFASDISEVTVSTPAKAKYKVIEKDPKILIIFENITEGENNVVTYLIDKHLSANVINDFDSPILFAKEIITKEELAKKEAAKPISKEETKEAVKKPIRSYNWVPYVIVLLVIAAVVYFIVKKKQ
ncbi:hypothetical protein HYX19_00405 [Candidatus Woesearchaeota archaeon]|nr:hypothetical protein [Candidatus Woesearchaeota archaeon]